MTCKLIGFHAGIRVTRRRDLHGKNLSLLFYGSNNIFKRNHKEKIFYSTLPWSTHRYIFLLLK